MASRGFHEWIAAGQPYVLIQPARDLARRIRAYGITVWHWPDETHQKDEPPEDHTPYSESGWPGRNARWNARGLDIMPRSDSFLHRKENADIARQLIADKDARVPGTEWIKYLNWTDEDGVCTHVSWEPHKASRGSTDKDHVHVSGRSDMDTWAGAADYDPIARMKGEDDVSAADVWAARFKGVGPGGSRFDFSAQEFVVGANAAAWQAVELLKVIAQKVEISDDEIAKIAAAAQKETTALSAQLAPLLAGEILQLLRDHNNAVVSDEQLERVLRRVLDTVPEGDLDEIPAPPGP